MHCWGAASTGVIVDDYDVTRALYHAVRAAIHKVAPGAYQIEDGGKYRTGTNLVRRGRWFTFNLTIYTPILTSLVPYDRAVKYAPDDVVANGAHSMKFPDGSTEAGCT